MFSSNVIITTIVWVVAAAFFITYLRHMKKKYPDATNLVFLKTAWFNVYLAAFFITMFFVALVRVALLG